MRRLGKGGMGEVLLGEDTKQHGRKVALKSSPKNSLALKAGSAVSNRKRAPSWR